MTQRRHHMPTYNKSMHSLQLTAIIIGQLNNSLFEQQSSQEVTRNEK